MTDRMRMATSSAKKWLGFAVKAGVTAGLIWYVLRDQDFAEIGGRLLAVSPATVALAILLMAGQSVLAAWRWVIVMRLFGDPLPFPTALRFFFEGLFFNQTLPSTVGGDAVRMYRAVRAGIPLGAGINGVLLDRIAGLFALLLVVAAMQPWLYRIVEDTAVRTAFAAVIALGLAGVALLIVFDRLPAGWLRWPLTRGVAALSAGLRRLFGASSLSAGVLALSLAGHVMMVVSVYLIARELGLGVAFLDCLALVPGVMLVAAVPISIAGWGVREAVMVTAMALIGVQEAGAAGLSILFGLVMLVIGLAGGVLWLTNPDHRLEKVAAIQESELDTLAETAGAARADEGSARGNRATG